MSPSPPRPLSRPRFRAVDLDHALAHASGLQLVGSRFIGYRFDKRIGFRPEKVESWVLERGETKLFSLMSTPCWLTSLWQAPSGTTFVASANGTVYRVPPGSSGHAGLVPADTLPGSIWGVWGLADDFVFAWGERGDETTMFVDRGQGWQELRSPGYVNAVHGLGPDLIYAVGAKGLVARWDGGAFVPVPSETDRMLSSVFVASEDEMYATGAGGVVLEGSVHGWGVRVTTESVLYAVAKWRDWVWVAGGPQGLFLLNGPKLELFKPKLLAESFDTRGAFLVSAKTVIAEPEPLQEDPAAPPQKFRGSLVSGFAELTEDNEPQWPEG